MAALATDLQWSGSIQLLTPEMDSTVALCISFWHKLSIGAKDSLSVHILREGELGPVLWILTGASPSDWEVSEVTVSSPSKFRVAFKATLNQAPDSHVLLDDVAVTDGACTPTGSCDFESGQCTWNSAGRATAKTHEWIQADGHFQGPETDHTTQTSDGRFLLSRTQNPNSKAVLVSERFQQISQLCFSFWIYINDSDSGTFRVFTRSATDSQDLLLETRFTEKKWIRFSNTLSVAEHIQIFLEAESESSGFIAIDDILITPNICQDHVNVSALTACQFEDGTCGWRDVSVGQFSWRRDRNGTDSANTGPSVDHTTGTELGWYMAVEADHGEHNSYAALQSPAFDQASVDCGFEFYYHMFGEGIGGLTVLLQEGSRLTPLLSISGDHGDEWRRAELGMGHTHQVFSLVLEATRTFSELGDIAVDDVSFFNCTLPETLDPCPTGFFSCSNHVCVEAGRVCDFSNDCGDMSDETRCESLGYLDRCSFERGLCWWESGHSDAQGPRWTRQKGQTTLPNLGPPRDHTRNSAAGYFLMPGQPLTPGEWTEILSRTLLPSSGCTVRFYHYSHNGGSEVRLSVKLRTERSGSSDYQLWSGSHLPVFRWQRAEITFSTAVVSKIVFRYTEAEEGAEGHSALDDVSFSTQCHHDPENSQLPLMPTTPPSTGATPTFTPTSQPCTGGEFFCWRSDGVECVPVTAQCDYRVDCPLGEDEETCGPCSFELGQCQWSDISIGAPKWQRQKSNDQTDPPQDHTTGTGYYMWVNASGDQQEHPALLQSPTLPPTSPYCQLLFHFHMARVGPGSVSVSLQSAGGQRDQLWSRTRDSAPMWSQEHLPLGEQPQSYTIIFSSDLMESQATPTVALDDVTFVNCETSYQPPDLPLLGCSFEEDLCGWTLDASGDLDWQRESGPTGSANTGPTGDHTSGRGHYVYLESSPPSKVGEVAQLSSPLLPPAPQQGYCITLWYHMFGATVGSLRLLMKSIQSRSTTLIWQRAGSQESQWERLQHHVTVKDVHQFLLEASVGGEAGDVAVDDISFAQGACPPTGNVHAYTGNCGFIKSSFYFICVTVDVCDFEEGDCDWQQKTDDDFDWARGSGETPTTGTGPSMDHTTHTATGHYYYLKSHGHAPGHGARMASPLFPAEKGMCLQFWYHMFGHGIGTLNIYQQPSTQRDLSLVFTQTGDQGDLWRFGQVPLQNTPDSSYRIIVEGVTGPSDQGDMAIDDVLVIDTPCPAPGFCDFELSACGWTNALGVDDADWLRGRAETAKSSSGPNVDHTTGSPAGHYLYADTAVGQGGDAAMLFGEIHRPVRGGRCLSFWYHMRGQDTGTLKLFLNNSEHVLWTKSSSGCDDWDEGRVHVDVGVPYWFVFEYKKGHGHGSSGSVALDDIHLTQGSCSPHNDSLSIGIGVGITLLVIVVACAALVFWRKLKSSDEEPFMDCDELNQVSNLHDCDVHVTHISFSRQQPDPSEPPDLSSDV
ncbi:MAM and LDL-receptor class A domain-containing protein 1 [Denticeps clupeoides]|uniref:MAM and LDL-receptor class A domain-containing protein 1 n=1 Tax=Denticeps clupeoides TaxID=299321 RepID=UPI0010A3D128|nr:MAM and LDL-receptor class A domain-containing protein 1-like [Denticeps clupeoides]